MTRDEQIRRVRRVLIPALGIPNGRGVGPLAERIVDVLAQPVEVTDEMVERAYRVWLGVDATYVPNRVGLRNMRAALHAAREVGR